MKIENQKYYICDMRYLKFVMLCAMGSLMVFSCKKDKDKETEIKLDPNCTYTASGKVMTNPYIYTSEIAENGKVSASKHLYVKTFVESMEEVAALEQVGQFLPFEWNREPMSDHSHIINANEKGLWMYGVIPAENKNSLRKIEVLEQLSYPEEESFSDGSRVTNFNIRGSVHFVDPIDGQKKPLKNITVIVRDGGKMIQSVTNDAGVFTTNQKLAGEKAEVLLKFDNGLMEIRTLNMNNLGLILTPNTLSLGMVNACAFQQLDVVIGESTKNSDLYFTASAFFAYQHFLDFAKANGYGVPPKKLNIWVARDVELSTGYAAPMLRHVGSNHGTRDLLVNLFNLPANIATNLANLIKNDLPDVYAPYEFADKDRVTPYNIETLYHEFGHCTQYVRSGNEFWSAYIEHIFNNGGYGNGTGTVPGIVAMSEAWAEDFSYELLAKVYGDEKYPHTLRNNNVWNAYRWIPVGIYYDLYDDDNTEAFDQVGGFTFPELYQVFAPEVRSPQQFRDQLILKYPAKAAGQEEAIHNLYKRYGYE